MLCCDWVDCVSPHITLEMRLAAVIWRNLVTSISQSSDLTRCLFNPARAYFVSPIVLTDCWSHSLTFTRTFLSNTWLQLLVWGNIATIPPPGLQSLCLTWDLSWSIRTPVEVKSKDQPPSIWARPAEGSPDCLHWMFVKSPSPECKRSMDTKPPLGRKASHYTLNLDLWWTVVWVTS